MNQLEDDLHRVLQLARAQTRLDRKARAGAATTVVTPSRSAAHERSPSASRREFALQRHRHVRSTERRQQQTPRATLLQTKLQGISMIYGLANTIPKLSDVSTCATRTHLESSTTATTERASHRDNGQQQQQAALEATLAARRERYRRHYSGLRATYGPTGQPKLQCLLDAAQRAKQQMAHHSALAVGAAALTSGNRIFASSTIESVHDAKFTLCAERAALLKALGDDPREVVVAMAICSDAVEALPSPCGSCREFMAECGDFPVFLVNAQCEAEETRSFELFPRARQRSTAKVWLQQTRDGAAGTYARATSNDRSTRGDADSDDEDSAARHPELPLDVQDWTVAHVLRWLTHDVELPQYCDVFERSTVDGCTLLRLEESDLQLLLGVLQPLHRRRLLVHIDRLKDRELLEHGIDYRQLQDYLAVLDRDRFAVVAELKATFDRLDENKDGFLDFREVRQALRALQCDATPQTVDALLRGQLLGEQGEARVSFPDFAAAFSSLAMQQHAGDSESAVANADTAAAGAWQLPVIDIHALRSTFDRADANQSGSVDAQELTALFQSLAKQDQQQRESSTEDCVQRARAWLEAADCDGDGRLSFAEFLVRYVQLMGLDISKLLAHFDAAEPRTSACRKPVGVLKRALETFFTDVSPAEVSVWYKRHLNSSLLRIASNADVSGARATIGDPSTAAVATGGDGGGSGDSATTNRVSLTISLSDFVLAVFLFQDHVRSRRQHMREIKHKLSNDALVHRSRIVHLQQSGHVRMCPRVGDADAEPDSLAAVRRAQQKQRTKTHKRRQQRSDSDNDDDGEAKQQESESDSDNRDKRLKQQLARLLAEADTAFDRFARAKVAKKRGEGNRAKQLSVGRRAPRQRRSSRFENDGNDEETKRGDDSDSDATRASTMSDGDLDACALNAMETAQAMTELGIACPRAQMLRLLKDEGVGIHDSVTRRDFRRLFRHWHAQSESALGAFPAHRRPATSVRIWDEDAEHAKRMEDMAALLRGEYGRHRSRQDYDEYLLRGHGHGYEQTNRERVKALSAVRARKSWTSEMTRFQSEKQHQKWRTKRTKRANNDDDEEEESKGDSSDYHSRSKIDGSASSNSSSSDDGSRGRAGRRQQARASRRHISKSRSQTHHNKRRGDRQRSASSRRHARRHNSRQRRSSRRRGSRSRSSSATSSSFSSNETTASEREELARRRRQDKWRGFEIGDRVAAPGDGSGTVIRLYRDYFVADVHFDSGKKAKNVDLGKLRRVDPLDDEAARRASHAQYKLMLRVGTHVAVSHRGTKTVRRGKITVCRLDGTFDVLVNELGELETLKRVQRKHLRAVTGKPLVYLVGARVTVRQKHAYLRGTVQLCRPDGSYDVRVRQDKSVLKRVDAELLSPDDNDGNVDDGSDEDTSAKKLPTTLSSRSKKRTTSSDSDDEAKRNDDGDRYDDDLEPEFSRGDRVEARFQGRDAYYAGKIVRVCMDGTFDIEYDDGDTESRVKTHLIRVLASGSTKSGGSGASHHAARDREDDYGNDGFESS